jgi:hypothetical protein
VSAPIVDGVAAAGRRARTRRLAITLALVAAAFYLGFIGLGVLRAAG